MPTLKLVGLSFSNIVEKLALIFLISISAIYGTNFCNAARKAFTTLTNNVLRVAALNSVGSFVLFLGKLVVVVATVLIGIQIMHVRIYTLK